MARVTAREIDGQGTTSPVRFTSDRGATLTEYAIVFFFLVVVTLVAVQYLDGVARQESRNQMDCVSSRPPPAECQIRAVTRPTTASEPATPPTTAPDIPFVPDDDDDPTTPPPPPPPPPPGDVVGFTVTGAVNPDDPDPQNPARWGFTASITLTKPGDPDPVPMNGSLVTFEYYGDLPAGGVTPTLTGSCVTDDAGTCQFSDLNYDFRDVGTVQMRVKTITAGRVVNGIPPPTTVTRPVIP
jgi:hypothetical protein